MCQKVVNVLAVASFAVSGAVVASGLYVYVNRDSLIDGVKSQIMEAVTGSLGGGLGGGALPTGANDLVGPSPSPTQAATAPDTGLGVKPF